MQDYLINVLAWGDLWQRVQKFKIENLIYTERQNCIIFLIPSLESKFDHGVFIYHQNGIFGAHLALLFTLHDPNDTKMKKK